MFEGFLHKLVDCVNAAIHCAVRGKGPPVLMLYGFPQDPLLLAPSSGLLGTSRRKLPPQR